MKVKRETLVAQLQFASLGLSSKGETLEQSNTFVFTDKHLITFNDEVLTRSKTPLDFQAAIVAADFRKILERIPDEEVDIILKGSEVIIKGAKKEAGITAFKDLQLPHTAVPLPEGWTDLGKDMVGMLMQAARTCGKDITGSPLTTVVHVTLKMVEACDNFRLFRATLPTGFPKETLLPAESLLTMDGQSMKQVSIGDGWAHFRGELGELSMRSSNDKYHDNLDGLLKVEEAEDLSLPANLAEIISRAEVMQDDKEPHVTIRLESGRLYLTARKEGGWYREEKRVKYEGRELEFNVSPRFLVEILERTREVKVIPGSRIKIASDNIEFVASLKSGETSAKDE